MKLNILILLLLLSNLLIAKDKLDSTTHQYNLKLETGHQEIGFPFRKPFTNPYHLYTGIGAERVWNSKRKHITYQTLDLGYFENSSSGNGYFVLSNYGYRYYVTQAFSLSGEVGIGFIHIFRPKAVYELNTSGNYEQIRDWGKIHPTINFNLQMGYKPNKLGVFIEYNMLAEFLYNEDAIIYPQTLFSLGINFNI